MPFPRFGQARSLGFLKGLFVNYHQVWSQYSYYFKRCKMIIFEIIFDHCGKYKKSLAAISLQNASHSSSRVGGRLFQISQGEDENQ